MSTKIDFSFNTALSGVSPETGAFQEEVQSAMAKRIRGRLMSQTSGDGVCGLYVTRYGMTVEYVVDATTREKVIQAAEEAIKWAAENIDGAFPLRGDKSPMAYIKTDKKSYSGETIVIAKLPSDLAVYPSASNWTSVIAGFAAELVKLNGVRGQDVYINQVELKIDTEVTTVEVAKKHIQQLLDSHASNNSSDYMPFESGSPVKVNWFTKEIMK